MYDDEKILVLEDSVINDPPEVTALLYKQLGEVPFTLRALGFACRYRGLEMVKALVEGGANFYYDADEFLYDPDYERCRRFLWKHPNDLPVCLFFYIKNANTGLNLWGVNISNNKGEKLPFLPIEERVRIAEYLCDHARETGFEPGDLLFYSIYYHDTGEFYPALKNKGVTLSAEKKKYIKSGKIIHHIWQMEPDELKNLISRLVPELDGKKPRLDSETWNFIKHQIKDPGMLRFVCEKFDFSDVKKLKVVEEMIKFGDVGLLENALEQGWLKQPQKRDEMIEFSSKNGKTECTALLLDYKNRCFDLVVEREKAERMLEGELNAAPDSARVLSRYWSFKKRPDGTFYIKGYLGDETTITIPEKIDGIPVTAVAEYAFSPEARVEYKQRERRKAITRIIVPNSVSEIGDLAFYDCKALEKIELPRSVNKIVSGENYHPFTGCNRLIISLHKGSYAEYFCKENHIPFEYI